MKYLILIILLSTTLFAKETIEVNIKSNIIVPDDFKTGLEEQLIKSGYTICINNGCKEIKKQVEVDIVKKSKSVYRFKARLIDLKNKKVFSVSSIYFKSSLSDYEKLSKLGKDITKKLMANIEEVKTVSKKEKLKKIKREKKINNAIKRDMALARMARMQENIERRNLLEEEKRENAAEKFYNSVTKEPNIINNFY